MPIPLGSIDPPIGTVIPYGAEVNQSNRAALYARGWLLCDGQSYPQTGDQADLFAVIGRNFGGDTTNFRVPDLRGLFPRGVDHQRGRDPDAGSRSPVGTLGAAQVGSLQTPATALPRTAMTLSANGDHAHSCTYFPAESGRVASGASGAYAKNYGDWGDGVGQTAAGGDHTHAITGGGDAETRPDNVYVNYLIKYRDPQPSPEAP